MLWDKRNSILQRRSPRRRQISKQSWANHRPTVSYRLGTTPYSAVAFAESRDSLGNSISETYSASSNSLSSGASVGLENSMR